MYWDPAKGRMMHRSEVIRLQEKVRALEEELARLDMADSSPPDTEDMVRQGGLVVFDGEIEPRFLGASSGIAMARLVMEQAKETTGSRNVRELFPVEAGRRRAKIVPNGREPKAYPALSADPAARLLTRATADGLVNVFCQRCKQGSDYLTSSSTDESCQLNSCSRPCTSQPFAVKWTKSTTGLRIPIATSF